MVFFFIIRSLSFFAKILFLTGFLTASLDLTWLESFLYIKSARASSTAAAQKLHFTEEVRNLSQEKKQKLILSEEDFLKEFLSLSPHVEKLKFADQKSQAQILQARYSLSDWAVFSQWNQINKNNSAIDQFLSQESKVQSWTISLQKKMPYGFHFSSAYTNVFEKSSNAGFLSRFKPGSIYRRSFDLELKANLTDSLSHFWLFKTFDQSLSVQDLSYQEQLEQLVLQALTQYWKTYLSYVKFQQAQESLAAYRKLVKETNDKQRYNFLQPGERPQILAEYQNIQSFLDTAQQDYDKEKKALLAYLKKDSTKHKLVFQPPAPAAPPRLKEIQLEQTRTVQIQKKNIENQEMNLLIQKASLFPSLEFVGKKGWTPAGESSDLSFSSAESFYELGISLKWILLSQSFYKRVDQKKYELEESKIDFEIFKQELLNQMSLLEQKIELAYKNIKRADKANEYRKKAFQELQKSFNQGRVDIFQLIQAEKQVRDSEIQKITALSEYSISLAMTASLRDELLEGYLKL